MVISYLGKLYQIKLTVFAVCTSVLHILYVYFVCHESTSINHAINGGCGGVGSGEIIFCAQGKTRKTSGCYDFRIMRSYSVKDLPHFRWVEIKLKLFIVLHSCNGLLTHDPRYKQRLYRVTPVAQAICQLCSVCRLLCSFYWVITVKN